MSPYRPRTGGWATRTRSILLPTPRLRSRGTDLQPPWVLIYSRLLTRWLLSEWAALQTPPLEMETRTPAHMSLPQVQVFPTCRYVWLSNFAVWKFIFVPLNYGPLKKGKIAMFGFAIIVFRGFSCSFKSRQSTWLKTLLGVSFFYFRRNEYFRVERHKNFGKEEREREREGCLFLRDRLIYFEACCLLSLPANHRLLL